jgi:hypothetical protein
VHYPYELHCPAASATDNTTAVTHLIGKYMAQYYERHEDVSAKELVMDEVIAPN